MLRELGVPPAEVCQRFAFADGGRFYLADYDGVIAAGISMHHAAFEVCNRAIQQWRPGCAFGIASAIESILILRRESPGEMLLIFGQDADPEVCALSKTAMHGRALVYACKNQRRFERHRSESAHRHSDRFIVFASGSNDGHAADKAAQRGAEVILAYRHLSRTVRTQRQANCQGLAADRLDFLRFLVLIDQLLHPFS